MEIMNDELESLNEEVKNPKPTQSKKGWINQVLGTHREKVNIIMFHSLEPADIVELSRNDWYIIGVSPRKNRTFILHLIKTSKKK